MSDNQEIQRLLSELFDAQRFGVLATENDGQPHTSLMAFAPTDELASLVFVTARHTRKFGNMQRNRRVAFLIDNRANRTTDTREAVAVMARGRVEEIAGPEKDEATGVYLKRHPSLKTFVASPDCAVMRLRVDVYEIVKGIASIKEWRIRNVME